MMIIIADMQVFVIPATDGTADIPEVAANHSSSVPDRPSSVPSINPFASTNPHNIIPCSDLTSAPTNHCIPLEASSQDITDSHIDIVFNGSQNNDDYAILNNTTSESDGAILTPQGQEQWPPACAPHDVIIIPTEATVADIDPMTTNISTLVPQSLLDVPRHEYEPGIDLQVDNGHSLILHVSGDEGDTDICEDPRQTTAVNGTPCHGTMHCM